MFRYRKTLLAIAGVCATMALAGCDQQSGIPDHDSEAQTSASASATSSAPPAAATTTEAPSVPVGAVPSNPQAAASVSPWAADLVNGDIASLQRKCWTIAPMNIAGMYADKQGILAALAQPGRDGQFAVTWTGPSKTVSVKRSEIASGYACPYVHPTGTPFAYNDADARHVVRRYLSRLAGRPVDPDDVESKYRLICDNASTWDPKGTGTTEVAPLSQNPNKLKGVTGFTDSEITSAPIRRDYVSVSAPVSIGGPPKTETFTLTVGSEGYCVGDVTR